MSDRFCTYRGDREEALVAYLYNDIEPAERLAFDAHLTTCELCSTELAGLGVVRTRLEQWAPPEPGRALAARVFAAAESVEAVESLENVETARTAWFEVPAWMQAIAAILVLGVAAGAANLHITYDKDGFSVETGWLNSPAAVIAAPEKPVAAAIVAAPPSVSPADLAALEQTLRGEIAAATGPAAVRQVRALLAESERKQENELALRMATLYRDIQTQRAGDLGKMARSLDTLSNSTGVAVAQIRSQVPEYVKSQVRLLQRQ